MERSSVRIAPAHIRAIEDVDEMRERYPDYCLPDLPDIRICPRIPGVEASIWRLIHILAGETVLGRVPPEPESQWIDYRTVEEVPMAGILLYLEKMGIPPQSTAHAVQQMKDRGIPVVNVEPVALKSADGKWVSACLDLGGVCKAVANDRGDWETFGLIALDDTRIALLALNGKWLGAHLEIDGTLKADIGERHDWEEFDLEAQGDGRIAIRAFNGKWVGCDPGSGFTLKADRTEVSSRESFELIRL